MNNIRSDQHQHLPCIRLANIIFDAKKYRKSGKSISYVAGFILAGLKDFVVNNISTIVDDTLDVREAIVDSMLKKLLSGWDVSKVEIVDNDISVNDFTGNTEQKTEVYHNRISVIQDKIKEYANVICRKGGSVQFNRNQLVSTLLSNFNSDDKLHFELCKGYLIDRVVENRGLDNAVSVLDEISTHEDFPSSFEVVTQIVSTISKTDHHVGELVEIVSSDSALSAKLIMLANSSLFGRANKTSSIENAIIYLGNNILRCTAVAAAMNKQECICKYFDYDMYWKHARARSIAAKYCITKTLGPNRHQYTSDEIERIGRAFTAGLLAKFGTLVYATVWPNDYSVINILACGDNSMLKRFEKFRFELDHNNITAELMKTWGFDSDICTAVRLQDDKDKSGYFMGERFEVLSALINSPRITPVIIDSLESGLIPSVGSIYTEDKLENYPELPPQDLEYMMEEYTDLAKIF